MEVEKNSAKKAKQHTVYKNAIGKRVPGVTTITGVLNKPALVGWANKIGLEGIEVKAYVDDLAEIGSLAHYMVECHINSQIQNIEIKPDLSAHSPNQVKSALVSFDKFISWEKKNKVKYLFSEIWITSEKYQYGGCLDCLALVNDKPTLIDLKTCKAVYKDHFLQVGGGYGLLAKENNMEVVDHRIIRIGRSEEEGVEAEDVLIPNIETYQNLFLDCLKIYNTKKGLKWY